MFLCFMYENFTSDPQISGKSNRFIEKKKVKEPNVYRHLTKFSDSLGYSNQTQTFFKS